VEAETKIFRGRKTRTPAIKNAAKRKVTGGRDEARGSAKVKCSRKKDLKIRATNCSQETKKMKGPVDAQVSLKSNPSWELDHHPSEVEGHSCTQQKKRRHPNQEGNWSTGGRSDGKGRTEEKTVK